MEKVICSHIAVDCRENDTQDIKMGGPQYLGFDFYVDTTQKVEMEAYIRKTMKELDIPILSLHVAKDEILKEPSKVWTKERIQPELAKLADYMRGDEMDR